ncbi:MAG: Aldehyde oxidase and xanthine dehydrogenase, molybdopterin binding, partial [Firmicutes bacterium]|nr:Aldehyde oxidase and xanthine dehydrogenase, molybdopterin binding [Bacillota bacterium]
MPFVKTRVEVEGHVDFILVEIPDNEVQPWAKDQKLKIVGQRLPRIDGMQRVTGKAVYTADIQLPGMVWAKMVRSPYPHAEIVDIDTSEAEKIPGVIAIIHHKNTPAIPFEGENFVFNPVVRYVGCEVAMVAAVNEHIARDAAEAIKVTYKVLPFVLDPVKGAAPGAPKLRPNANNLVNGKPTIISRGDIAKGEAESDVVVEQTFHMSAAHHCSMEPHGSVANWEQDGQLVMYDSSQSVNNVQSGLAAVFKMPKAKVRVVREFVGGGFGSKTGMEKYHVITALMAQKIRKPVKLTLDRSEEITTTGHRPETVQTIRMGAKKDGTITFIDVKAWVASGAYAGRFSLSSGVPAREMYQCANVRTEEYAVFTNHMTNSAMRGPGNTEAMGPLELMVDKLAYSVGMDALDFRAKNDTPYADQITKIPYSSKGLAKAYALASKEIDWAGKRKPKGGDQSDPNIKHGVGVGSLIWATGGGPPSAADVIVSTDGSVTLSSAFNDLGEGAMTAMAMVTAEELGVPVSSVIIRSGDTALGVFDLGTFGSRLTASLAPAVRNAAADARKQVLDAAAQILARPVDDLSLEDGIIKSKSDATVSQPLAKLAANFTHVVVGKGFRGPNPSDYRINSFGAQFAEV